MTNYIIVKNSRDSNVTYNGPAWNHIDETREEVYESEIEAQRIAYLLSDINPVGFYVKEKD